MKSVIRLALLSLFALFLCLLVWLSLKAFEDPVEQATDSDTPHWVHPMSQMKSWELRRPTRCESSEALTNEITRAIPTKDQVWFIDIQPQRKEWVVFCSESSSAELFQKWQKGHSLVPLRDHFLKTSDKVIFNIHASQKAEADDFLEFMKDFESSHSIGVVSASRFPIEKIRKERPQWIFGSDRASWTKVLAFSSFGLSGLVNAWADFYIVSVKEQQSSKNRAEFLRSLSTRRKILIKETPAGTDSKEEFYRGTLRVSTVVAPESKRL